MNIFMTGGTGFVGTYLTRKLITEGHKVTILTPSQSGTELKMTGLTYLEGNPTIKGKWQDAVGEHDVIINLAGASIFSRWTPEQKKILRESRIETTRNLVSALPADAGRITLFSTSAVGYYGFHEDEELTENMPAGDDFLAKLAYDWEKEALNAQTKGTRVVITRLGIVLGKNGGALGQMIPLFKLLLGGPLGSGKQWFSWVHMEDLAQAFIFLLKHPEIKGAVNLCSPQPLRNADLGKAIGRVLHRPSFMPAPGFMIKLILGEFGSVLLKGQRVIPRRLLDAGFKFRYPDIEEALKNIILD
ncbi:cell division inhibitor [hydrocarbon metagenome]|uniref:Cell division inhibitor n=1 Tax=hydrocarbon metagenome TaxID=938273 RepID=A0A0W8FSA5_9ZZZZ